MTLKPLENDPPHTQVLAALGVGGLIALIALAVVLWDWHFAAVAFALFFVTALADAVWNEIDHGRAR